jgi:D-threo-aldose 1-dehydrogenase
LLTEHGTSQELNVRTPVSLTDQVAISRLGLGCAPLMRLPSRRRRRDLIAGAIDAGLTHFDVARLYGLGAAERELGAVIRSRRDEVTIATKFGIDAAGVLRRVARLQGAARAVLAKSPSATAVARAREDKLMAPRRYDAERARLSLDKSLEELGLDHVDILFLHDPRPQDDVDAAALHEFLTAARTAGKIRTWGVSLDANSGLVVLGELIDPGVIQLLQSPLTDVAAHEEVIAFGLAEARDRIGAWLMANLRAHKRWAEELNVNPLDPGVLSGLVIGGMLVAPGVRAALYETADVADLSSAVRFLSDRRGEGLVERFVDCVMEDRRAIRSMTAH